MAKTSPTNHFSNSLERLREMDWDYAGDQSDSRFSALHFYPGRLISQIPAALIGSLSSPGDWVLDPYCGSGTTVLEAQRLGRHAVGIDINPIALLIGRAKGLSISGVRLRSVLFAHLRHILDERLHSGTSNSRKYSVPETVQGAKWFHPATLFELSVLWAYIEGRRGIVKQILEFCFSSILISACSETRHWGYICDNTRPLSLRYENAYDLFEAAIEALCVAYEERDRRSSKAVRFLPRAEFHCGDSAHTLREYPEASFGLVVCSPPYYGVVDYVKAQRLTMEWFGKDIEGFRQLETGARSKRHRLKAFEEYVSDIHSVFSEVVRVLRPGAFCCVILGQSTKRTETIPQFIDALSSVGLTMEMKIARDVAVQRRQRPHISDETLLIFRKPPLGT